MRIVKILRKFVKKIITAGVLTTIGFSAVHAADTMAPPLDSDLQQQVQTAFPDVEILIYSSGICNGDASGGGQIGLVIKTKENFPLHALYAIKNQGKWSVTDLPKAVHVKGSFLPNFLHDYWNGSEVQNGLDIRCVNVSIDPTISQKNKGAFVKPAMAKVKVNDLCFSADTTYNSWVCLRPNASGSKPEMSFVQMNAD